MHAKNNRVYMMTAVFIRVIINQPEAKNLYILPIFPYKKQKGGVEEYGKPSE